MTATDIIILSRLWVILSSGTVLVKQCTNTRSFTAGTEKRKTRVCMRHIRKLCFCCRGALANYSPNWAWKVAAFFARNKKEKKKLPGIQLCERAKKPTPCCFCLPRALAFSALGQYWQFGREYESAAADHYPKSIQPKHVRMKDNAKLRDKKE